MVTQRDIECAIQISKQWFSKHSFDPKQAAPLIADHVAQETRARDERIALLRDVLGACYDYLCGNPLDKTEKALLREEARAALANTAKGGE